MSSSNTNTERTKVPGPHKKVPGPHQEASGPNEQESVPDDQESDLSDGSENSILPEEPANPYPWVKGGSWAGINKRAWTEMHRAFLKKNPEFKKRNLDENGRPKFVEMCEEMWVNDIMALKTVMNRRDPTGKSNFRDRLETIVREAGFVDQAVCLALGQFDEVEEKYEEAFKHQLAFFLLLRDMLEKKQGNKIPIVFQDPNFKAAEEYILSIKAGGKVVQHPEAVKYMTTSSFVFAPYIQNDVLASTVLLKRPVLYIGNSIESEFSHPMGRELARRYIRQAYMTGDHTFRPDMRDFIDQTNAFHNYYEKDVLDEKYDDDNDLECALRNMFVHHPKRQHPKPVVSNAPAFGFAAVKSVSTAPSIGHLTDSADTMSSASDDTALSSTTERLCVNSDADPADNASKSILESSQGESSGAAEPVVPPFQQARPEVGLKGTIHASARRGSSPSTAQSPINPALDPRNFPYRNKTDKVQGRWSPSSR